MKKIYHLIMAAVVCVLLASCTTTQKFSVQGTAGTEIYTAEMQRVGVIGSDGKAKITLPSDGYFAYLLSKSPSSNLLVPFALDYKKASHTGAKFMKFTGMGLAAVGCLAELVGLIAQINGAEDVVSPFFVGGAGAVLAGVGIGMPADMRLKQTSYDYQFEYLKWQQANTDIQFTQPVFTEPYKNLEQTSQQKSAVESKSTVASSSTSRKHLTQKSSKTLRDYGKQTEGEYTGTGSLTKDGETIESYDDIIVRIVRVSKDVVSVNVVEANGSEFFETSSKYKIVKKQNGTYVLTNSDIRTATITIDKSGKLTYNHPKVNIDGDVYTLKIIAK